MRNADVVIGEYQKPMFWRTLKKKQTIFIKKWTGVCVPIVWSR